MSAAANIETVLRENNMFSFQLRLNVRTLGTDGVSHEQTVVAESVQEVVDIATAPRTSALGVRITSNGVTIFPTGGATPSVRSRFHLPDSLKGPFA
jgi:hypothetical protein